MASYDPHYSSVKLLLRGNGTDNSQTVVDDTGKTISVFGNTCIKTGTKKFGSGSLYFDGTGDYLSAPIADLLTTGGEDVTMDGWLHPTAFPVGAADAAIMRMGNINFVGQFGIVLLSDGKLRFSLIYSGGTFSITSSSALSLNTWNYFAVSRVSGVFRMYINSSKVAEGSQSNDITYNTALLIGGTSTTAYYTGYMDDLRYTKYGRYATDTIRTPVFEVGTNNNPPSISITSVTPHQGPTAGGTSVSVVGSGFTDFTTCTIDGNSLTSLVTVSDTELTGLTPAGTLGLKDVVVSNP